MTREEYERMSEEEKNRYWENQRNGGGYGRRRNYRDKEISSVEELIKSRERLDELEIERYDRMETMQSEAESWLEREKDSVDEILEKQRQGIELLAEEVDKLSEAKEKAEELAEAKAYLNNHTSFGAITKSFGDVISNFKQAGKELRSLLDPIAKADKAASKYARTLGMTGTAMRNLRDDTIKNIASNDLAAKFNVSTEELLEAQGNYMKAAGRNIRVDNADQANIAAIERVVGSKGIEMAGLLDNFGVGVSETAEKLNEMYNDASKEGLSFEKYSDNVAKNIKLAQNYTFKNGIKGLESMAKKATALKIDMQQVASFADKVSTVEGAMDSAAKLQVLGGPFAQMADPLGMLNEGLTDMEGLQDRMAKMIGGLGTFDKESGEVRVSAFNKQRIKAAADAMGVSYDSLMESTNAQARRGEISKQIESNENARGLSDDMKELIKNSGSFKDGKAGVTIRGQFKSLDELTDKDYDALKKETQSESEDIKDIAVNTRDIVSIEEGFQKQREAHMANMTKGIGDIYKGLVSWLSEQGWLHTILNIMMTAQVAGSVADLFKRGGRGLRKWGRGTGSSMSKWRLFRRKASGAANRISGTFSKYAPKTSNFISRGWNAASKGVNNAWTGAKGMWRSAGNTVTSTANSIVKGGAAQTGKRALIKTVGKTATTKAIGIGSKLATGVVKGGPLGIVGAIGDIATDGLVASGKMEKGGVGHHIGKGLSGAATGASIGMMVGSIIPGIGNAIGGAIGAAIGGTVGIFKAGSAKEQKKIEDQLKGTGVTMKGDYGRGKLEKINHALKTGYIDDKLRAKLKKKGDQELLTQIDKKAAEQKAKGITPEKMKVNDGIWGKMARFGLFGLPTAAFSWGKKYLDSAKGKKQIKNIKNKVKNSAIGKALGKPIGAIAGGLIGKSSKAGKSVGNSIKNNKKKLKGAAIGMALGGSLGVLAGGLIGKHKQESDKLKIDKKSSSDILNKFNSSIKPIPEKGVSNTYGGVDKSNKNIRIKTDPHDINLNGTLKLQGENGQSIDLMDELRNNPQMKRQLAGMLQTEMGVLEHGANISQRKINY